MMMMMIIIIIVAVIRMMCNWKICFKNCAGNSMLCFSYSVLAIARSMSIKSSRLT